MGKCRSYSRVMLEPIMLCMLLTAVHAQNSAYYAQNRAPKNQDCAQKLTILLEGCIRVTALLEYLNLICDWISENLYLWALAHI